MSKLKPSLIDEFKGPFAFLSNFADSPISMKNPEASKGIEYPTAEHAYQALKTLSTEERRLVAAQPTARMAKRVGRQIALRDDWEEVKYRCMESVLSMKFGQNPELAYALIETHHAMLVEGNTWCDQIWGNCTCPKHESHPGQNALGILLMYTRLAIRSSQ